ncbi:Inner membrane protein YhaH [anaerobic digester metagenome]
MNSYIEIIKKYAVFTGRESRRTFWYFVLFNIIFSLIINLIGKILHTDILSTIYSLALFLPSLGASIRRLHDINKSGWWILLGYIPFAIFLIVIPLAFVSRSAALGGLILIWLLSLASIIWLIVLEATAGTPGENKYGEPV